MPSSYGEILKLSIGTKQRNRHIRHAALVQVDYSKSIVTMTALIFCSYQNKVMSRPNAKETHESVFACLRVRMLRRFRLQSGAGIAPVSCVVAGSFRLNCQRPSKACPPIASDQLKARPARALQQSAPPIGGRPSKENRRHFIVAILNFRHISRAHGSSSSSAESSIGGALASSISRTFHIAQLLPTIAVLSLRLTFSAGAQGEYEQSLRCQG